MSTTAVRTVRCPKCGTSQPETLAFCNGDFEGGVCHEYLRWTDLPSGPEAGDGAPPTEPPPEPCVQMTVELPGFDPGPGGVLTAGVTPGDQVLVDVTLRNIGRIVDCFSVEVQGLPRGWVTPATGSVDLVPIGHVGTCEGHVRLVVRPPRDSSATAAAWPVTVVVRSKSRKRLLDAVKATLIVLPFFAITATSRPQLAVGRTKARFLCDVRNNGNATIAPTLVVTDALGTASFSAPSEMQTIAPGHTTTMKLGVRAPRVLIGRPTDHQLTIVVAVDGLDPPTPPLFGVFRQRPLIAWWVPIALALALALAIALYAVWPRRVTMPSVRGLSSAFVAQRVLERAGLKAKPTVLTRVRSDVKAGTVLDQGPAAGKRVDPNVPVELRVAVPATFTIIPDLVGMTVGKAEEDLVRRYLKLGKVVPAGAPPSRKIASQVPLPGRARGREVTAVDVVLAPPGTVKVPSVVCDTLSQAEKKLTPLGFKLATPKTPVKYTQVATAQVPQAHVTRAVGTSVMMLNFATSPKSCTKSKSNTSKSKSSGSSGSKAGSAPAKPQTKTIGSVAAPTGVHATGRAIDGAGEPVAFDDGSHVLLATSAATLGSGEQPAWSPDGTLLAVRQGSRIAISKPAAPHADPRTIVIDGRDLSAPAFAPAGSTPAAPPLLSFLATPPRGGVSELCIVTVASAAPQPSCRSLPRLLGRSIAWSPGGGVMLVVGARPGLADQPGVLRLHDTGGDRARASSWSAGRLLWRLRLDGHIGSIFDAAYDPAGQRLAVVTDLGAGAAQSGPQVAVMPVADWPNLRDARWLGRACQLAWSPTGDRLALVAADAPGGCPANEVAGRLVTLAVDGPQQSQTLSNSARNPAWRP